MTASLAWFLEYEKNFMGTDYLSWHKLNSDVPIIAISLYLVLVFGLPKVLKVKFKLKTAFAVWNLCLSIFSIMGASRVVPYLFEKVMENGLEWTICKEPTSWYANGPQGLWMALFIYSKFPELGDTLFLVLQGKKIIFLHWFHHVTVLLYCWHAYHNVIAAGIWFAAMNYSVHSIMYFYYFMAKMGFYKIIRPFAPLITCIQILQMVGGIYVLSVSYRVAASEGGQCDNDSANVRLGLFMYFSYFCLFCVLFYEKYMAGPTQHTVPSGCMDDIKKIDSSGFFRQGSERRKESEKKAN